MPALLRGSITFLLFVGNTIFWGGIFYIFILLRFIIPVARWRAFCARVFTAIAERWIDGNVLFIRLTQGTVWDFEAPAGINYNSSYLVVSNHRSWLDIPVLQRVFNHRIPLLRFFLKSSLIGVPILGLIWWALDFPFMRRYTKAQLEANPALKGKDIETVRAACAKFQHIPVSILNFLEGTRFTEAKRQRQNSPYTHLLPPRAGGIAGVIASMGRKLSGIINVTIVYSQPNVSLWDFLCGRLHHITVRSELLPIPEELLGGDYEQDAEFRQQFQDWVNALWQEKDALIERLSPQRHRE